MADWLEARRSALKLKSVPEVIRQLVADRIRDEKDRGEDERPQSRRKKLTEFELPLEMLRVEKKR
jgi:hypothetical protein